MFFVPIPRSIAKERGFTQYFTGKPCNKGEVYKRFVSSGGCTCPAHTNIQKGWRSRNPEKAKECTENWRKNNLERYNHVRANWREANYDKVRASNKKSVIKYRNNDPLGIKRQVMNNSSKKWRSRNPEKMAILRKEHYNANRQYYIDKATSWSKNNPQRFKKNAKRSYINNRENIIKRVKEYRSKNKLKVAVWFATRRYTKAMGRIGDKELTNFVYYQSKELAQLRNSVTSFKWHIDHMIPLRAENVTGLHVWNNFQCIPSAMNTSKGNKLIYTNPHEWLYDIPKFFKVVYQQEIAS